MSVLSKHLKSKKPASPASSSSMTKRPKLYVLATKPAVPDKLQNTEWSLELSIPQTQHKTHTSAPAARRSSPRSHSKHSFLPRLSYKHKGGTSAAASNPTISGSAQEETPLPDSRYYFSRFHPDSLSVQRRDNTMLKIFLCSIPSSASPTSTLQPASTTSTHSDSITTQFVDALSSVRLAADSMSWLRQALLALQAREMIPSISHGLDINKFMGFAISFVEQHARETQDAEDAPAKAVNYSKIARENERLRGMFSADGTDYTVINRASRADGEWGGQDGDADGDEDEDMWNVPVKSKAQRSERGGGGRTWGGFWITHGSGAAPRPRPLSGDERQARDPWQRSDPYGGLM